MRVIELNCHFIGEGVEVRSMMLPRAEFAGFVSSNDVLKSGSYHEVFLLQSKLLTFEEVVVRIKHSGDIFCQITINHSLYVVTVVN